MKRREALKRLGAGGAAIPFLANKGGGGRSEDDAPIDVNPDDSASSEPTTGPVIPDQLPDEVMEAIRHRPWTFINHVDGWTVTWGRDRYRRVWVAYCEGHDHAPPHEMLNTHVHFDEMELQRLNIMEEPDAVERFVLTEIREQIRKWKKISRPGPDVDGFREAQREIEAFKLGTIASTAGFGTGIFRGVSTGLAFTLGASYST